MINTKTLVCKFDRKLCGTPYTNNYNYKHKVYHYLYDGAASVKAGDFAIICRSDNLGSAEDYGICTVTDVIDAALPEATKFVITVLDLTEHDKRIEKAKARSLLISKLKELEKQQSELDRFDRLAAANPAAADLLAQLKAL